MLFYLRPLQYCCLGTKHCASSVTMPPRKKAMAKRTPTGEPAPRKYLERETAPVRKPVGCYGIYNAADRRVYPKAEQKPAEPVGTPIASSAVQPKDPDVILLTAQHPPPFNYAITGNLPSLQCNDCEKLFKDEEDVFVNACTKLQCIACHQHCPCRCDDCSEAGAGPAP